MTKPTPVYVLKVGGSLLDMPDLARRLHALCARFEPARLLFFPGGGKLADVVRDLDRIHRLGEEASHWLALRTLSLQAQVLARLLDADLIEDPRAWRAAGTERAIIDPYSWALRDDDDVCHCPHSWEATSDSLALRLAQALEADALFLLKSTSLPEETTWQEAADMGLVDRFFPSLWGRRPVRVRWLDLRRGKPGA